MPGLLATKEDWRKWKEDVDDHIESLEPGLKATARVFAKARGKVGAHWFGSNVIEGWDKNQDIHQLLNIQTNGDE